MSATILLRCPGCGRTLADAERAAWDPPAATVMLLLCEDCNPSDFDAPSYIDSEGREVMQVPA